MIVLVDGIKVASLTMSNSGLLSPVLSTTQTATGYLEGSTIDYDVQLDFSSSSSLGSQYGLTSRPFCINHTTTPGSHSLSFVLCDLQDAFLDSAVFINNVGAVPGSLSATSPSSLLETSTTSHDPSSSVVDSSQVGSSVQTAINTHSTSKSNLAPILSSTVGIPALSLTLAPPTSSRGARPSSSSSSSISIVTRTILTTNINTVTSCAASISSCPGRDQSSTAKTAVTVPLSQALSILSSSFVSNPSSLLSSSPTNSATLASSLYFLSTSPSAVTASTSQSPAISQASPSLFSSETGSIPSTSFALSISSSQVQKTSNGLVSQTSETTADLPVAPTSSERLTNATPSSSLSEPTSKAEVHSSSSGEALMPSIPSSDGLPASASSAVSRIVLASTSSGTILSSTASGSGTTWKLASSSESLPTLSGSTPRTTTSFVANSITSIPYLTTSLDFSSLFSFSFPSATKGSSPSSPGLTALSPPPRSPSYPTPITSSSTPPISTLRPAGTLLTPSAPEEGNSSISDVIVSRPPTLSSAAVPPTADTQPSGSATPERTQLQPQPHSTPTTPTTPLGDADVVTSTFFSTTYLAEYTTITVAEVHTPAPPRVLSTKTVTVCPACTGPDNASMHEPSALAGIRTPYYAPHATAEVVASGVAAPSAPAPAETPATATPATDAQILRESTSSLGDNSGPAAAADATAEPSADTRLPSGLTAGKSASLLRVSDSLPFALSSATGSTSHGPTATVDIKGNASGTSSADSPPMTGARSSAQTTSGSSVSSLDLASFSSSAPPLANATTSVYYGISSGISASAHCPSTLLSAVNVVAIVLCATWSYL